MLKLITSSTSRTVSPSGGGARCIPPPSFLHLGDPQAQLVLQPHLGRQGHRNSDPLHCHARSLPGRAGHLLVAVRTAVVCDLLYHRVLWHRHELPQAAQPPLVHDAKVAGVLLCVLWSDDDRGTYHWLYVVVK
jgi:hypothetical protein